jgi:dUTP pyrophosphatase
MKVRIAKLDEMAQVPAYANETDAGMDLVAISRNHTKDYIEYGTGLSIEIPEGYVGLLFPRSSISKTELSLANSVGVIDSGYRGEIKLRFKRNEHQAGERIDVINHSAEYEVSDKVAQLIIIPYPKVVFEVVDSLTETARGAGGFGSTGK